MRSVLNPEAKTNNKKHIKLTKINLHHLRHTEREVSSVSDQDPELDTHNTVPVGPLLTNTPELICRSGAHLLLLLLLLLTQQLVLETRRINHLVT